MILGVRRPGPGGRVKFWFRLVADDGNKTLYKTATASCYTLQRFNTIHFSNNYIIFTKFNSGIESCECNILVVGRKMYKVKSANAQQTRTVYNLTLRRLMSYIYGAPILDVSRSHTTTQYSR